MLLFSPRWLFLVPGAALFLIGATLAAALIPGPIAIGRVGLDIHTMLVAGFLCLVGYQVALFAVFTKIFAVRIGLHPPHATLIRLFRYVTLETGLLAGTVMAAAGTVALAIAVWTWTATGFGALDPRVTMREAIPAVTLLALGVQTIFASFFLSILGIDLVREQ
jgi:hypothetical protein